ncbi:hypothetical protein PG984_014057 [Apiospora sp. TS-2023a]
MLSSEVIVALALGIPSFVVAVAALWIAYLTYTRQHLAPPINRPISSWPSDQYPLLSPNGSGGTWASSGYNSRDNGPVVPQAAFPAEGRPVRRRRVN